MKNMKQTLSTIVLSLTMGFGTPAAAETAMFSSEKITAAVEKSMEKKDVSGFGLHGKPKKNNLGAGFYSLAALSYGATVFDTGMTFRNKAKCEEYIHVQIQTLPAGSYGSCHDTNPLIDPLVQKGQGITYGIELGITSAVVAGSAIMKKKAAKAWWLPMAALSGWHFLGGINNMRQYNDFQKKINELR